MTYHNYIFFESDHLLHNISDVKQKAYYREFLKILESDSAIVTNPYSILGLKHGMKIFFWFQSDKIENIQNLLNKLIHTRLGKYLKISHTLFGMSRPTQYSHHAKGHLDTNRKGGAYLIIYPFTKTNEWYRLDFETRRKLMGGHVGIGKKYHEKITQLLLYSYGIDASEFIVSYETDDLSAFQTLVMELRSDEVRKYTQKDTPIFTGIYKSNEEVLAYL